MKQEAEKLVYMIKLLNYEFPKQEWEKLQSDKTIRKEISDDLYSIYKIIDCNVYLDKELLIKCLEYNNYESKVSYKISTIHANKRLKIHASELAKVLTKQDLDELLIALIKSGFKEYAKYLINLNVK